MKTLIPIFGLLACCLPAAAEGPHRVKIVNAAAVMPSKVVENATILIEDGRIAAVGTDLEEAFEGAEVIDAAGRYAAPASSTCTATAEGAMTSRTARSRRCSAPPRCTRSTERR